MSFDHLRQLLSIISDAIDAISLIYSKTSPVPYVSPPPSPSCPQHPQPSVNYPLDFPSLDAPYDKSNPAEVLATDPNVVAAIARIVAACGQMTATVQSPFLSLCDASMAYHLPSCMRVLEASHTVEVLREAGPAGMHVQAIADIVGMDPSKLGHILRLLATHHITREVAPNVFANNRISSMLDTGKNPRDLVASAEDKYQDTNGISAFVGLCTDELFKSSAYLTEAYLLSPTTRFSREPTHTPFNFAFATQKGFFGWLEEGAIKDSSAVSRPFPFTREQDNKFRLERFGKAMTGSSSWEAPDAILNAFDWDGLPPGSLVVDVGGGIGSTAMFLGTRCENLRFVIQDREIVVAMGERAWRARSLDMLDSGRARFQVHDFFTPQPIRDAAVFLLRVVLHDWPDAFARRILVRLREAAREDTRLIIADFVLPHACADDFANPTEADGGMMDVEGAESMLACPPLLANLGKGSAQAYWMDMTMQVTFNSQERTLREIVTLAASTGWKVVRVTRAPGSLFGHIIAVPVDVPSNVPSTIGAVIPEGEPRRSETGAMSVGRKEPSTLAIGVASSRCGTPTFGSRVDLPSFEEAFARFEGRRAKDKFKTSTATRGTRGSAMPPVASSSTGRPSPAIISRPAKKKVPSPLTLKLPTLGSEELPPVPLSPVSSQSPSSPTPSTPPAHRQTPNMRTPKKARGTPVQNLGSPPLIASPRRATKLSMSPRRLWNATGDAGTGVGMASLLGGETNAGEPTTQLMPSVFRDEAQRGSETSRRGGAVLAAAAKIERGGKNGSPA